MYLPRMKILQNNKKINLKIVENEWIFFTYDQLRYLRIFQKSPLFNIFYWGDPGSTVSIHYYTKDFFDFSGITLKVKDPSFTMEQNPPPPPPSQSNYNLSAPGLKPLKAWCCLSAMILFALHLICIAIRSGKVRQLIDLCSCIFFTPKQTLWYFEEKNGNSKKNWPDIQSF
jgi:hypothetical protein